LHAHNNAQRLKKQHSADRVEGAAADMSIASAAARSDAMAEGDARAKPAARSVERRSQPRGNSAVSSHWLVE